MKFVQVVSLSIFLLINEILARRCINLNGNWKGYILSPNNTLHRSNVSGTFFNAIVPGGVYTDLVQAGIIADNFVRDNDVRNRWVGNMSFAFTREFQLNETFLHTTSATLTFHGVDTFAKIFVNDELVGETSNMFVRYSYNVTEHLKIGTNQLKVVILSPVQKASELFKEQSLKYVVPPKCVPEIYNGECHVNHIRKMQASFSWDWGPAFPSMGIWKDVELEAKEVLVTDMTMDISKTDDSWEIGVTIFFDTVLDTRFTPLLCHIYVNLWALNVDATFDRVLSLDGKASNISVSLPIPYLKSNEINRWWPNGYGDQSLYDLFVEITFNNENFSNASRHFKVGFRTVELVQESLTKGLSFYFKVNDVPIFAKGSNWIPSSVFPELSADEQTIRQLLKSAKEAHMNMLRVWGGGYYESDLFYQLADEYGIMIWQDFMFACAMYPSGEEFLESVRLEVKQNVRRLQHHPSIVLWAGNNENEVAIYGNWYGTGDKKVYKQDYVKLYVNVIKSEVERIDRRRPFVVSSPSDGIFTERNNYLGPDPYSNLYGDVHYYNYINNGWDINGYPRTRFASEYGVQSIPSIHTLATAAKNADDLELQSAFMKHRQHLIAGYESMEFLLSKNFEMPRTKNATVYLIDYIYLTQINQAVSIRVETEFYRQAKSTLNAIGEGMTMGALYWQLNDVWQAPSWSSIEFGGRWKMLHYYAVEFFAPVIVTPHISPADDLELYVVSDLLTNIENCSLAVKTYMWNSGSPIHTQSIRSITIPSNAAKVVTNFWLDDYLRQAGCGSLALAKRKCFLEFVVKDKNGTLISPYNYVFPAPLKTVTLPVANIRVRIYGTPVQGKSLNELKYAIELRSNCIALFVWMEVGQEIKGRFSENGFHIIHGIKTVLFHPEETTTAEMIRNSFSVITLSDIYNRDRNSRHFVTVRDGEPRVTII